MKVIIIAELFEHFSHISPPRVSLLYDPCLWILVDSPRSPDNLWVLSSRKIHDQTQKKSQGRRSRLTDWLPSTRLLFHSERKKTEIISSFLGLLISWSKEYCKWNGRSEKADIMLPSCLEFGWISCSLFQKTENNSSVWSSKSSGSHPIQSSSSSCGESSSQSRDHK